MGYYKILTNRFAEWKYGDIAAMDDRAAETPLKNGEIEPAKGAAPVKKVREARKKK